MHIFAIEYAYAIFAVYCSHTHIDQVEWWVCKYFIMQAHNLTIWVNTFRGFFYILFENIINIYINAFCECAFLNLFEEHLPLFLLGIYDCSSKLKWQNGEVCFHILMPYFQRVCVRWYEEDCKKIRGCWWKIVSSNGICCWKFI